MTKDSLWHKIACLTILVLLLVNSYTGSLAALQQILVALDMQSMHFLLGLMLRLILGVERTVPDQCADSLTLHGLTSLKPNFATRDEATGKYFLAADPSIQCYHQGATLPDGTLNVWGGLLVIGVIALLAYPVGIIAALGALLYQVGTQSTRFSPQGPVQWLASPSMRPTSSKYQQQLSRANISKHGQWTCTPHCSVAQSGPASSVNCSYANGYALTAGGVGAALAAPQVGDGDARHCLLPLHREMVLLGAVAHGPTGGCMSAGGFHQ